MPNLRVSAVQRQPYIVAVALLALMLLAALWALWRFDQLDKKAHRLGHGGVAIVRLTEEAVNKAYSEASASWPTRQLDGRVYLQPS